MTNTNRSEFTTLVLRIGTVAAREALDAIESSYRTGASPTAPKTTRKRRQRKAAPKPARAAKARQRTAGAKPRAPRGELASKILETLKSVGSLNVADIARETGIDLSKVRSALPGMKRKGQITSLRRGVWARVEANGAAVEGAADG